MSDCQQRVLFCGELSEWGVVSICAPQESILGPLLFGLYINDLPSVVTHCYLSLYADDVEFHFNHSDLCVVKTCLQSDLDAVAAWPQQKKEIEIDYEGTVQLAIYSSLLV